MAGTPGRFGSARAGGRHVVATKSEHGIQATEPDVVITAVPQVVEAIRQGSPAVITPDRPSPACRRGRFRRGASMNQSELIEKVAQATELNQAAAGRAVKAVRHPRCSYPRPGRERRVGCTAG